VAVGYKVRCLEWEASFWEGGFGGAFELEAVRVTRELEKVEGDDKNGGKMELFGEEEGIFVFIAKKRKRGETRDGDDTFATLMFYRIDIDGLQQ